MCAEHSIAVLGTDRDRSPYANKGFSGEGIRHQERTRSPLPRIGPIVIVCSCEELAFANLTLETTMKTLSITAFRTRDDRAIGERFGRNPLFPQHHDDARILAKKNQVFAKTSGGMLGSVSSRDV
jgi:hypothetical protein